MHIEIQWNSGILMWIHAVRHNKPLICEKYGVDKMGASYMARIPQSMSCNNEAPTPPTVVAQELMILYQINCSECSLLIYRVAPKTSTEQSISF